MGLRVLVGIVLAGFLSMTGLALAEVGYFGFFEAIAANSATRLLSWDLVICLTLISVWMVRDARGWGAAPFVLVAALFGAAGPLLYLLLRPRSAAASRS